MSSVNSCSDLHSTINEQSFHDESSSSMNIDHSNSSNSCYSFDFELYNTETFKLVPYDKLIHKKSFKGLLFDSLDIGLDFYKTYGKESGFDVNMSSQKRYNDGTIRIRYSTCSRSGFTESFKNENIHVEFSDVKGRRTSSKKNGCPAVSKFKNLRCSLMFYIYVFVEDHNHELVAQDQLHLLRINRTMDFLDESFIHKFMMSFDSAMEKQRHHQSLLDYQSTTTTPKLRTPLAIEKHASKIYTHNIFLDIQKELYKSVFYCVQESVVIEDESEVYVLRDKKKKKLIDKNVNEDEDSDDFYRNSLTSHCPNTRYKVVFSRRGDSISISCSCMLFIQEGLLCRHMFFILNMKEYDEIPSNFILRRWGKYIIADGLLRKKNSYPHKGSKNECLIQDVYAIHRLSINKIANNEDELAKYIKKLQEVDNVPDVINIHNSEGIRNKGWASGKRIKSTREKVIEKSKKGSRLCSLRHKPNHNARSCILRLKKSDLESEVTEG
ncbi:unnamed protein product [Lactuca virosa]|uniref:SWIM-type domain-containing protein n=1 Tax=Lactuca virosa TaxID=75947 RepID=A0AAU9LKG5_9ASTR|nr:unnamed protein product [Lactuca virosa]